ncbi:predicted protein [Aspergillus nidulans FGSC A4]|uniref:Uncharacterized protein n=1 Tax=Emericella nidulans (strain FGSC A4 / ATCC 38163 / CBS 112.46 / NRRL 194 / M139) TaxID=227321 RepID=Q5AUP7_EMENI|nr:hypothetical protein [Aspergillus nidulans FGSC A4]EAA58786.1 predicted protein [Aspergillus nidulans FGSC A4]CBF73648.1 TPA: conserved hypothetical protein [Aspergillus nidulans FGSC A4]|eukprot:XP_681252.1 predicted protein [Aspergillus nidulans FGSC A4]
MFNATQHVGSVTISTHERSLELLSDGVLGSSVTNWSLVYLCFLASFVLCPLYLPAAMLECPHSRPYRRRSSSSSVHIRDFSTERGRLQSRPPAVPVAQSLRNSELAINPELKLLLSAKRTIIATCAVVACFILIGFNRLHLIPAASKFSSEEAWGGLKPYWTTEQEETRFAYVQYATNFDYLCNAPGTSREQIALTRIRQQYPHVKLRPVWVLSTSNGDPTWHKSLTKFYAFDLTECIRVLVLDSDSMVLNNMDHYFLSSRPRGQPNKNTFERIIEEARSSDAFDMEVLNRLRVSHQGPPPVPFRGQDAEWNATVEVSRAYLVHFSDWPLPKPWLPHSQSQWEAALPEFRDGEEYAETPDRPRCAERFTWTGFMRIIIMTRRSWEFKECTVITWP